MADRFRGVFVALATPMDEREAIDFPSLQAFVDYHITEGGIHGLVPLGSTGEYYALSETERADVVKAVIDAAEGRVPVVVGTNAGSTQQVIDLSQQAARAGAAGVLLAPPYYSLPTPQELFEHFRLIDRELDIPIILYNYPARTGVDLTPDLVSDLAELENVQYLKESTGDSTRVSENLARSKGRIELMCGSDAIAFESLWLGAVGWVAGIANVIPRLHVELYRLARIEKDYDAARELFFQILPLFLYMEGSSRYTQFVKAGCSCVGHPVGPPRKPLQPASAQDMANLSALIRSTCCREH